MKIRPIDSAQASLGDALAQALNQVQLGGAEASASGGRKGGKGKKGKKNKGIVLLGAPRPNM